MTKTEGKKTENNGNKKTKKHETLRRNNFERK